MVKAGVVYIKCDSAYYGDHILRQQHNTNTRACAWRDTQHLKLQHYPDVF